MTTFLVTMTIETDTIEHARVVIGERLGYDEEYDDEDGKTFDYTVNTLGDLRPRA